MSDETDQLSFLLKCVSFTGASQFALLLSIRNEDKKNVSIQKLLGYLTSPHKGVAISALGFSIASGTEASGALGTCLELPL